MIIDELKKEIAELTKKLRECLIIIVEQKETIKVLQDKIRELMSK